jgi:molecular chaperone DnaK (HSP70)
MRLGIDFGTTRVVVAAADRGNYPIVTFETESGDGVEWFPSLVAVRDGVDPNAPEALRCGHDALAVAEEPGWALQRSIKRELTSSGLDAERLGLPLGRLAVRFLEQLRDALLHRSNLGASPDEPLEVAIAVPANASATQRLLTADAFAQAGFKVLRILDEPSAAGLEYAWRRPSDAQVKRRHVAVYDLGGGTFDASVIGMSDALHEVLTTEGVTRLGGDDFDEALLALACHTAGVPQPEGAERQRLLEACRSEKERTTSTTKRLQLELGDGKSVTIPVSAWEEALSPLISDSLAALDAAIARTEERLGHEVGKHTVVYQVGGGSQLPAVGRALRDRFGRRVWRSPYPHASVAIGLAIAAEEEQAPRIAPNLTRHFGVWRERDAGRAAAFDPIFPKDTALPTGEGRLEATRRYRAAHNIGHFRYVECSRLEGVSPAGDVTPWAEIRSPLVATLAENSLDGVTVERLSRPGDLVEERYFCDGNGVIEVAIANLTAGYERRFSPRFAPASPVSAAMAG